MPHIIQKNVKTVQVKLITVNIQKGKNTTKWISLSVNLVFGNEIVLDFKCFLSSRPFWAKCVH